MKILLLYFLAVWAVYIGANKISHEVEYIGIAQANLLYYLTSLGAWECEHHSHTDVLERHRKATECVKNISYEGSFCKSFLRSFKPCVNPLLQESGQCDGIFGSSLKNILIDTVIAEIDYICRSDGEHILELVNPCVIKSALEKNNCKSNKMLYFKSSFNLTEICSSFPDALNCLENEVKNECQNAITRNMVHDFFSVDVKPCNIALEVYLELIRVLSGN